MDNEPSLKAKPIPNFIIYCFYSMDKLTFLSKNLNFFSIIKFTDIKMLYTIFAHKYIAIITDKNYPFFRVSETCGRHRIYKIIIITKMNKNNWAEPTSIIGKQALYRILFIFSMLVRSR